MNQQLREGFEKQLDLAEEDKDEVRIIINYCFCFCFKNKNSNQLSVKNHKNVI